MRNGVVPPCVLLLAILLSGCAQRPPPSDGGGTTPDQPSAGQASSVSITTVPAQANAGSRALVCWRVEGSGNVAHVAVHHGTESHAGAGARYSDYPSAAYPGNASGLDSAGYALSGTFCTSVPVGDEDVYVRAHVIDSSGGDGKLSSEARIRAIVGAVSTVSDVEVLSYEVGVLRGERSVVCWRVGGSGTAAGTSIRVDNVSHSGSGARADDYRRSVFPDNESEADGSGYGLPGEFCTSFRVGSRDLYFRAHAAAGEREEALSTEFKITSLVPEPAGETCNDTLTSWSDAATCSLAVIGRGTLDVSVTVPGPRWGWQVAVPSGVECTRLTGTGNATFACEVLDDADGQVSVRIAAETTDVPVNARVVAELGFTALGASQAVPPSPPETICNDSLQHWSEAYKCTLVVRTPGTLSVEVSLSTTRWGWSLVTPASGGVECSRLTGQGNGNVSCDVAPGANGEATLLINSETTSAQVPIEVRVVLRFTPEPPSGRPPIPTSTTCTSTMTHWADQDACTLYVRDPGTLSISVTLPSAMWGWSVVTPASGGVACSASTGDGSATFSCSVGSDADGEVAILIAAETASVPVHAGVRVDLAFTAS